VRHPPPSELPTTDIPPAPPRPAAEDAPTPSRSHREDPLRRAALIGAAAGVPLLVALIVLVNVVGGRSGGKSGPVAEISGTTAAPSGELPVLSVPTPPVTAEATRSCPALLQALPTRLVDEPARRVRSVSPYVRAWGDPAVVLVCGVQRPARFTVGAALIQIDGVQWFVDTSDPNTVVWTAVDRPVYVQVRVPASTDSASVTELTAPLSRTLPARKPSPGS
jgi:hypothetical protein